MKSRTKPALGALPPAQVQISLPVQGVLHHVRLAFLSLCIDAGQILLAAMMEAERIALCGPKGVPDAARRAVRGPMILTSNQSFGAWGEVFGDRVIATAIRDRLLDHAVTMNIRGNS